MYQALCIAAGCRRFHIPRLHVKGQGINGVFKSFDDDAVYLYNRNGMGFSTLTMSIFIALNTACRRLIAQSAAAVAAVNEPLEHPCDRLVAAGAGSVHFFLLCESVLHCLPELLGYDRLMLSVIHDYILIIIFALGSGAALLAPSDLAYIHGVIEHIFDKSVLGTGAAIGAHSAIAEAARYIHLTATGCIH